MTNAATTGLPGKATGAKIPLFYRIAFVYLESLFILLALYFHLVDPDGAIRRHFPAGDSPPAPPLPSPLHYRPLLLGYASGNLLQATLVLGLLPKADLRTWRIVQFGQVLYDAVLVVSMCQTLDARGRLSIAGLAGAGDTLGGIVLMTFKLLPRVFFLAGVGLGSGSGARRVKSA